MSLSHHSGVWVSGLSVLVLGALAALVAILVYKARADARRRASFLLFSEATMRANQAPTRSPDMRAASEAFVQVVICRQHAPNIDLHALEMGCGDEVLNSGGTIEQALSARWGGACAIHADLDVYKEGIASFEARLREGKTALQVADPKTKFRMGATYYLSLLLAKQPGEYERFLRHINA